MSKIMVVEQADLEKIVSSLAEKSYSRGYSDAMNRYVTVKEAAFLLGETPQSVYLKIKHGMFQSVLDEKGKPVRILKSEVLAAGL